MTIIHTTLSKLCKLLFYSWFLSTPFLTGFLLLFVLSCSETPTQYTQPSTGDETGPMERKLPFLVTEATNPTGGHLLYQPEEVLITEEEKDISTRKNSLVPINYQDGSAANINMETTYGEAQTILKFSHSTSTGQDVYKEGIVVGWRNDPPRTPNVIFIISSYQGTMDFGPWIGENRHRRVGHSFADQFSVGQENQDILTDPKARHFITSLYKHLENKPEDCLETQACTLSINPQGNYILFQFAKMVLLFGNNERRKLVQIAMLKDDAPACLKSPFDLLTAQFFCEQEDGSKIIFGLGDSHKEVIEKSGISPNLPITYENTILIQRTKSTIIGWKRKNFEEKTKQVPDTTHLSLAYMGNNQYNIPFLLNQSLIKVSLGDSDTVQLSLEPLAKEGTQWTMKDISDKLQATAGSSDFYLSTEMPQIKGNVLVQNNLIKAFFNLLEETYTTTYSSESSKVKIHKKVFREYDDRFALEPAGFLIASNPTGQPDDFLTEYPVFILVIIDNASGRTQFQFSLMDDDFENHVIKKQQETLDLLHPVEELAGFKLGDKIYLRDKKTGPETAIVAYPVSDSHTLITLADYLSEIESEAVYTSGRDNNIVFEKSEAVSVAGGDVDLYILPTSQTKEIEGQEFDEYEIHKITVTGSSFFGTINSLCAIEGFDIKLGLYDRTFTETLTQHISVVQQNSSATNPFKGCTYISPADYLFSGLKRQFFFPSHKLILSFGDRELFAITIYKKPIKQENKGTVK